MKRVARSELETDLERRVVEFARDELGVTSIKLTPRGSTKWPDRLFFVPGGRPLWLEFKRPGEEPDPMQAHRIETLRRWGYDAHWTDDYDAAVARLRASVAAGLASMGGRPARRRRAAPAGGAARGAHR